MEEALEGVVGDSTWLCSGGPGGREGPGPKGPWVPAKEGTLF